jgi:putative DNA primase/helicase
MNTAKLIFSANEIPALKYEDDAYYGRWVIIPFDNSVYGREDTQLLKRLTTDNELSGILNWALDGLDRLKDNEWQFSYSDDSIAIYRRKSNPVIAFLEDCCEEYEGYVLKSDLMMAYNRWAKSQNLPPSKSRKAFSQAILDQEEIPVEIFRPNIDGDRPEAWRGIRLVT